MSLNRKHYEEKRDFIRMNVDTSMTYIRKSSNQSGEALCMDLSGNGLLFEQRSPMQVGEKLELSISTGVSRYNPLQAEGVVVRSERREAQKYVIACRIELA